MFRSPRLCLDYYQVITQSCDHQSLNKVFVKGPETKLPYIVLCKKLMYSRGNQVFAEYLIRVSVLTHCICSCKLFLIHNEIEDKLVFWNLVQC